jgi:quercetin dioxygenase-like cupin family protein
MSTTTTATRTDPSPSSTTPAPLPPEALVEIAKGIAASPLWAQHANHDDDRRPVRLLATPSYEVWVLGWITGQSVELHDHGDAAGAIVVTEGALTEIVGPGPIDDATRITLPAGAVRAIPVGLVHDVLNLSSAPATSIHVYSPPLSTMTFYDPIDGHAVRIDDIDPEHPVLDPNDATRVLHPARLQPR